MVYNVGIGVVVINVGVGVVVINVGVGVVVIKVGVGVVVGVGVGVVATCDSTCTVVVCWILVFPGIVVALVTVAVGVKGTIPPFSGSQTPPPSWACTVGRESK